MATLRTYVFAFSMIFFSAGNAFAQNQSEQNEVVCDTIYKNYKIRLIKIAEDEYNEDVPNTIFSFQKLINGKYVEVFKDSIYSKSQYVMFEDFNKDNVKDILVSHTSDTRSNEMYYLYLLDVKNNSLKKVKRFTEIKNPRFIRKYGIIESYVVSGTNWLTFYKLEKDTIREFEVIVTDKQDSPNSFDKVTRKRFKKY
ncbi:MAG TPA: hypothetical protein VEC36_06290 [Patescibacteria group bacterium]|nr:hypothetical protein [Patescibacteria group bacterium]